MVLLVVGASFFLKYSLSLSNPLDIRKIEGKIYPKISKLMSYETRLFRQCTAFIQSFWLRLSSHLVSHMDKDWINTVWIVVMLEDVAGFRVS